ncbi:MAG: RecQ family ATP-dependent DNA helicase [bacterium]|nr:RecQ family ATP-dependent DNA helicase [bacterium]MDD3624290.1 RecQ family ATP-dependent DNA helicase [Proteiniphilum sp.]MDD3967486.1 RecQ family ATP-dependent DNA helicase [Proteiniphilum sp.]MDD4458273.1 RecQ family ATP-dependent DNA helicase [Proteiniphilum sp.]
MQPELFRQILRDYWGYDSFRTLQEDIIQSVWEGRDTLGLMPTGGGKSLTFQVPVMAMEGLCLVVTPLIALMKDQVDNLRERGIKAAAVYSGMSREEIITTLENCIFGGYKFLYVSPERLSSDIFLAKLQAMSICLLVVDESHCISQWGYDFRPSYLKISGIRRLLEGVPVLALTATATTEVVGDIQEKLHFRENNVYRTSFLRKNLSYVVRTVDNKIAELTHILHTVPGSSIVYVRSRQQTKEIAQMLQQSGIPADYFHAGLSHDVKTLKQSSWKSGDCRVIVATNAFGMGIDKADVRTVVHMDLPNSPEEYFQEAGRAGRDGERSYAVILYSKADSARLRKRITDAFPAREFVLRVYEALGNYYQVAVGAGFGNTYDFSLHEFCMPFKFPFLQTHHALKMLELAGYIEYTEEIDLRSRIRFLIYRDEMYALQLDRDMDELLHTILRNYTGLFSDDVYIDESLLAARTGKSRREVCEMLVALSRMRYIRYVPQKKTPFIVFTTSREDLPFVSIPRQVYEERKKRFEKRITSMLAYVEEQDVCRSRMLLFYFGEKDPKDCGDCDVCRRKNEAGVSNYLFRTIRKRILAVLETEPAIRLNNLVDQLADQETGHEKIIRVIRFMVDTGELSLQDDRISLAYS